MIVCRQCNHSNPDGTSWCQQCNAFLEFEGESQPTQATPAAPAPGAPAQPPGTAPPTNPGPAGAPPANRGESLVARPGDRPPPAPPADPSTAPRQPGEPAGGAATQQLPPATAPASDIPPIRPGEIVCPVCGWGNEPTRRFCRHDGAVLSPAGGGRGQPDALQAGQRRRRTGGGGRGPLIVVALLVPVLVAAAVLGVVFLRPGGNDKGKGKAGGKASPSATASPAAESVVVPAGAVRVAKVSSQSGGRVAKNLLDGKPETFWSTAFPSGIPGNAGPRDIDRRPQLQFAFDPAVTVTKIEIINGASGAEFGKRSRAKRCFLQFPDGSEQSFELDDQRTEFQTIEIKSPKKISSLVLNIVTSYQDGASETTGDKFRFSLAEVRFFARGS